ncbi:MAG TPA: signal peptide peptidase SppA [Candidatus Hydrogenedentes bacterium]|nr:signal peptide peptidase SppA [Candidatus Hydrogenedentota bacterium]HPG65722.1 signal peptide peptidase SppA [Candidatus Hydrogenedentota bacterium]
MSQGNNQVRFGCLVVLSGLVASALLVGIACVAMLLGNVDLGFEHGPGVAVLDVYGELIDQHTILDQLDALVGDPDTQAIVVRVDSPGGDIAVIEEVFNGIKRVRDEEDLPVFASMGSVAASGGYYVCCAAERIFANQSSMTGSMGVIMEYPDAHRLLDTLGITFESIKSGEFKDMGAVNRPLTGQERAHLQELVQDYHRFFVELVSEARPIEAAEVQRLADGSLFTGRQAVALGLVDEIGDLDHAICYAAEAAGIEGEPRVIRVKEKPVSLLRWLDEFQWMSSSLRRGWAPKCVLR